MTSPDSLAGLDTSVFWLSNQAGGWVHLQNPRLNLGIEILQALPLFGWW